MKILYIPLDERPCNAALPEMITQSSQGVELINAPLSLLGKKKQAADIDALFSFVEQHIANVDAFVFSVEMMIYGGLLPSRLHHCQQDQLLARLSRLMYLAARHPKVKLYAFNLIMRTPRYDSSDEEPDYYGEYGARIFRQSWLRDQATREQLNSCEQDELATLQDSIPAWIIEDYEQRRAANLAVLLETLRYFSQGRIAHLSIPQDDSSEYGYTAIDQRTMGQEIDKLDLFGRVHLYPGADEVGAALIARAVNDVRGKKVPMYAFYASTLAEQLVPLYEDRPLRESLRAHVAVVGGYLVDDPTQAELILAINTPGKIMQESWDQFEQRDVTYSSYRHLPSFVEEIGLHLALKRKVILVDGAYANGGDYQLINLLDRHGYLDQLISYKGWNTFCNTLGTSLAQGILALEHANAAIIQRNLLQHLLDDVFYQAKIRMYINRHVLPALGLHYFSLGEKAEVVMQQAEKMMHSEYTALIKNSFPGCTLQFNLASPWNRMFEIDVRVTTPCNS